MQILLDSLSKHYGRFEASLLISKCNAPFFLSFLPYALLMGAAMGWRFLDSASDAAIYSVQTVLLLLAIRPCCTMLIHSQSTNDTRGFNLTSVSLMAVLILNTLVFLRAAVVFFISHRHPLCMGNLSCIDVPDAVRRVAILRVSLQSRSHRSSCHL